MTGDQPGLGLNDACGPLSAVVRGLNGSAAAQ